MSSLRDGGPFTMAAWTAWLALALSGCEQKTGEAENEPAPRPAPLQATTQGGPQQKAERLAEREGVPKEHLDKAAAALILQSYLDKKVKK